MRTMIWRSHTTPFGAIALVAVLVGGCAEGEGSSANAAANALQATTVADPALVGAIDIHAHLDPDGFGPGGSGRFIDAVDLARLARQVGMRGFVIKNHYDQSADVAYLTRKVEPGVEVFGGIGLNFPVGGLNAAAVRQMADIKGGWGRIVWMPTWNARHYVTARDPNAPYITVSENGELLPQAKAVIAAMADVETRANGGKLALATGHNSPEESILLVREARRQGLEAVVTHPVLEMIGMTTEQMQEIAAMGGYLEFVAAHFTRDAEAVQETVDAIRAVGVEHSIVSSDSGQGRGPEGNEDSERSMHIDVLAEAARALRAAGFTESELDMMFKENPARLLGVPVLPSSRDPE